MDDDTDVRRSGRRMPRTGVLAVVGGVALLTAACSGGASTPQVASLGHSTSAASASPTATLPTGNPTQLLDEWATCMRSHGDPTQTDPTIDANKVIHIVVPAGSIGQAGGPLKSPGGQACQKYLAGASTALNGGKPLQKPDAAKLEKFSECMRANGIPDFPDPSGDGLRISSSPGSDLNPNSPAFKNAVKLCANKTGIPALSGGTRPPGSIQVTSTGGPQGGPVSNVSAGANG